jgi:hypothetical protein
LYSVVVRCIFLERELMRRWTICRYIFLVFSEAIERFVHFYHEYFLDFLMDELFFVSFFHNKLSLNLVFL